MRPRWLYSGHKCQAFVTSNGETDVPFHSTTEATPTVKHNWVSQTKPLPITYLLFTSMSATQPSQSIQSLLPDSFLQTAVHPTIPALGMRASSINPTAVHMVGNVLVRFGVILKKQSSHLQQVSQSDPHPISHFRTPKQPISLTSNSSPAKIT